MEHSTLTGTGRTDGACGANERPEPSVCPARTSLSNPVRFLHAAWLPRLGVRGGIAATLVLLALAAIVPAGPAQAQVSVELEATANGQTQIDLSWEATVSQGWVVFSYRIQDSPTGADGTWTWLATLDNDLLLQPHPDDSYSHTGLAGGTTRYYRLRWGALGIDNSAAPTDGVSNTTSATTTSSATSPTTSD